MTVTGDWRGEAFQVPQSTGYTDAVTITFDHHIIIIIISYIHDTGIGGDRCRGSRGYEKCTKKCRGGSGEMGEDWETGIGITRNRLPKRL